jgi:hypothetical protein
MKPLTYFLCPALFLALALCAETSFAWDAGWRIRQEAPSSSYPSGARTVEMNKKFDYNSMKTFRGTADNSNDYTVMRNLNGSTVRGYVDKNGSGLLRDEKGHFIRVNTLR